MNLDKYKIISSGQLLSNIDYSSFKKNIKVKIKLSDNKIKYLVNGKKHVLKKHLDLEAAEAYKNMLRKAGLDVWIHVDFNKAAFLTSLVEKIQIPNNTNRLINTKDTAFIKRTNILPSIYNPPKTINVKRQSGQNFLFKINAIIGTPLIIFLTVISALFIQSYILILISVNLGMRSGVTTLGIAVFFFILIYFPLLICNKRNISITIAADNSVYYHLIGSRHLNIIKRKYFLQKNGSDICVLEKKRFRKFSVISYDQEGSLSYYTTSPETAIETARDSANDAASDLINSGLSEYLGVFSNLQRMIRSLFKTSPETSTKDMTLLCLILNDKKKISARVYTGINIAVEVCEDNCNNDDFMRLFLTAILAVGLY